MRWRVATALVTVASAALVLPASPVDAVLTRSFAIRYQTDTNGAIDIFANTLLTCPTGSTSSAGVACATARNPSGVNSSFNNQFAAMSFVDADGLATTTNSSMTTVTIPTGSTVLFAGLYWGARSTAASRSQISFRTPGQTTYATVTASQLDVTSGTYQGFADVTTTVRAAGSGQYWAGNITATTNTNDYAGWSLVVVYENSALPLRNLTVFDGYGIVQNTVADRRVDINLSGFLTPPFGAVTAEIGVVAYEGDGGNSGDQFLLNNVALTNAQNPANDFFNASISTAGVSDGGRNPGYQNQLGFDADEVDASGRLANSATSATVTLTTSGDAYQPGVVTTQIDLYSPSFPETVKTVVDLNGGTTQIGDVLRYSVSLTNVGLDPARSSVIRDAIPSGTTYVPGTLIVNGTPRTDAIDGDVGEFDGSRVQGFVGTGATGTAGGTLGPNQSATLTFDVRVDAATAGGAVSNQAAFDYIAQTLNKPFTFRSNIVTTPVDPVADLRIVKSATPSTFIAGGTATYTLTVTNDGPNPSTNVRVTDALPAALASATVSPAGCSNAAGTINCALGTLAVGASITVTVTAPLAAGLDPATVLANTATVAADVTDPDPSDNSSTITTDVDASTDLRVSKSATPSPAVAGAPLTYTVTITNDGPSIATAVQVAESLPAGLLAATLAPSAGGSCSGSTCTFAAIAPGASATVTISGTVASSATGSVANTVTVSSATPDPDPTDNAQTLTTPVATSANLSISKSASPSPAVPGAPVTYTITVNNAGPSDAAAVSVSDTLPPLGGVTATPSAGTCTIAASVACALGGVPAGGSASVSVVGTVPAAQTTALANSASVTSSTPDPAGGNNSTAISTPVAPSADLVATKTASPNPIVAGQNVTYTVTVRNDGPSSAADVTVTDTLPPGLTLVSSSASQGSCSGLTCAIGSVAPGVTATTTYVASVPAGIDPTTIADNSATATSSTADPDPADNTANVSTSVATVADLRVAKSVAPAAVNAGETASWTITVTNDGPSAAGAFEIVDVLDGQLGVQSASIGGTPCAVAGQTVTCASAGLAVGASATVTLTSRVAAGTASGAIANSAAIANAATADPTLSNNTGSASLSVTRSADMTVAKSVSTNPIVAGQPVTIELVIDNLGPSDADAVVAADPLPAGWTLQPGTDPRCSLTGGAIDCDLGVLAASDPPENVTLVVLPPANATTGPSSNTAFVSSATPDPSTSNNSSTAPTTLTAVAGISVTKVATPDPVVAGETVTYTITVANAGPSDAPSVALSDPALAGLSDVALTPSQGSCSTSTFTCALGIVPAGSTAVVTATGVVPVAAAPGVDALSNTVTATSPADSTPANNTATVLTDIARSADLVMSKSASPAVVPAGDPVTWTIAVTNQGPSVASNVTITDTLPPGIDISTATFTIDTGTCSLAGAALSCGAATLLPGETITVTLMAQVEPDFAGTSVTNNASADADEPDDDPTDNTDAVTVSVQPEANLTITKNPSNPDPVAGDQLTWVIQVYNDGPSVARNVDVADTLPSGFAVTSVVSAPAGCIALPCDLGDLDVGALVTIIVQGTIDPSVVGPLANTATLTSDTDDPDPSDNSATATPIVKAIADLAIDKQPTSVTPFVPGTVATWTITVTNPGPSDATDVVVTDVLPATAFSGVTLTPSSGTCPTTTTCNLGTVEPGTPVTIAVSGTISPVTTATSITNRASVTSATPDPDPADNSTVSTVPLSPVADLSIQKLAVNQPFVPGQPVTWTLRVRNAGPSSATGITVTDTLPTGATIVSATPTSGTCTGVGTGSLSCSLGTLATGVTRTVTLVADLAPDVAPGTLGNTAVVAATTADPNLANNSSTVDATVTGSADVSVTKAFTSPIVAGATITWDVVVANAGPSDATLVSVTDSLPADVTVPTLPAGCTGTTTITCAIARLADGASTTISFTGTLDPDARGALSNTANVTSATADPNTANNSATAGPTAIGVTSAVVIDKIAPSPAPVPGGAPGRWTITLTNNGPSTANGVVIDDPIAGATSAVIGSAGTSGSCTTAVTCTIGDLPVGVTVTVLVDVAYPANATSGTVGNTATVTAATPLTGTTSDTATFTLVGSADLSIRKSFAPDPVTAGQPGQYVIEYSNLGPSDALGVTITDTFPSGVVSAALAGTPPAGCALAGLVLNCTGLTVAAGASGSITVDVVTAGVLGAGDLDNSASIASSTADPDPSDNTATVEPNTANSADVAIAKSVSAGPFVAGAATAHEWTIVVTNAGPSTSQDVVVTDLLPAGVTAGTVGVAATGGAATPSCSVSGSTLACSPADVPRGASITVTVPFTVDADTGAGPLTNSAAAGSEITPDPGAGNNVDGVALTVERDTDVTFAKVSTVEPVTAGETAGWTISGTVIGPSTAEAAAISDTLPVGFTPTSAILTVNGTVVAGGCTIAGRLVSCPLGALDPGDTFTVDITADVDPSQPAGTVTNNANFSTITPGGSASASDSVTVDRESVLTVIKARIGGNPTIAGTTLDWTITVTNPGPSTATDVTVTDIAPAGYTITAFEPTQGSCALSCALGTLTVGASATITVRGTVDPSAAAGTITNRAEVDSAELVAPVAATGDATIVREASLRFEKTAAPAIATAGEPLTYTLTVVNDGPSTSTGVVVSDALPAALLTPVGTPSTGTTYVAPTWTVGTLAPGASATLDIAGVLEPAYLDASITNSASVTATTPNPGVTNASVTTPVLTSADVVVTKSAQAAPPVAGQPMTWTIIVANAGPSNARNVVVDDAVPAGFTVSSVTGGGCSTFPCTIVDLPPNAPIVITVVGDLDPGLSGLITNTAMVTSDTDDPNTANNSVDARATIGASADLTISKAGFAPPFVPGTDVRWTIVVTNTGPSDAQNVEVADTVPAGLASVVLTPDQGTCTANTCALGTIPYAQTAVIQVTGRLAPDFAATTIANTASVTSSTPDADPSDNTVTSEVAVTPAADLTISKAGFAPPFVPGTDVRWTIVVTNTGPSDAQGVEVVDTVPAGLASVVLTPDQGTCTANTCALGTIPYAQTAVIEVTGRLAADFAGATISNTASVSSTTPDADPSDNSVTSEVAVTPAADLRIEKVAQNEPFVPGSNVSWVITVTNDGPSSAQGVTVTDTVPAGATIVSAAPTSANCTGAGSVDLTCDLGTVATGAAVTVTLTAALAASAAPGSLDNTARVTSSTPDPDAADNASTDTASVVGSADVSVVKTLEAPATVVAGSTATWQIVVANAGPSDATGVVLTDDLAPVLSAISVTDPACTLSGNALRCEWATLAPGATRTITVSALVAADFTATTLANTAGVASATPDPVPANNGSTATSDAVRSFDLAITKTVDDASVPYYGTATFTLIARNDGPSLARDVVVADALPAGLIMVSAGPDCAVSGGTSVTCAMASLPAGQTATFTIVARGTTPGAFENCATVAGPAGSGAGGETDPADNRSCTAITVEDAAELVVTKSTTATTVVVGQTVPWVVTVRNVGPSAATEIMVVEQPAAGLTIVDATPSMGSYDIATGRWTIPSLAAGSSATLTVQTRATTAGQLSNSVSLSSATPDAAAARAGLPERPITASAAGTISVTQLRIPSTGADSLVVRDAGLLLLLAGGLLLIVSRRRRVRTR